MVVRKDETGEVIEKLNAVKLEDNHLVGVGTHSDVAWLSLDIILEDGDWEIATL